MAVVRELLTRWGFDVDTNALERFDDKVGVLRDKVDRTGRNITDVARRTRDFATGLAVKTTLPIVGIGVAAIRTAANFEAGMNRVAALTGAAGADFDRLQQQAKDLGIATQFSASQAADAMGFLAQAGFDAEKIYAAMPDTLNLAGAAQLDLGSTADIVSNVMSGMQIQAEDLGQVVDVLSKAFISSNTDLSQLGQAMKYAGPVASGFNLSLEDTVAILGLMGNAGIQASLAGTSLRGALTRLASPTKAIQDVLDRIGVSTRTSSGGMRNLVDILKDIEKSGAGPTEVMEIFGQRAGPAMSTLLASGIASVDEFSAVLSKAGGTAARIQKTQLKGLNGALKALRSAFEGLAIAFADSGILGAITSLVKNLTVLTRKVAEWNSSAFRVIAIIGLLVAAIAPALWIFSQLSLAVLAVAKAYALFGLSAIAIPALILAAVVAIGLLVDDFLAWKEGADSVIGTILEKFPVINEMFKSTGKIVRWLGELFNKWVLNPLNNLGSFIGGKLFDLFGNVSGEAMVNAAGAVATPSAASAVIASQNNNRSSVKVNANINVAIPEGTAEEQKRVVQDAARNAAEEVFNSKVRQLAGDHPQVE